jgi:diacylglycerol kinase family enzyme
MRAILFHNPAAGGGKFTKKELITALRLGGFSPRYVSTKGNRFKKILDQAADLLIVAGGDGTVAKVIAQMPDRRIPVAIIPLGSANNIARTFGIAGAPYELAEILHPDYWQRCSIGVARGPWGRQRFVEAVGLGPLARMIDKPSVDAKGVDSLLLGRRELGKMLRKAKPLDIDVMVDGKPLKSDILSIEVVNTVYTGPGLPLAPSADPGDRVLEVVCVRPDERKAAMAWITAPQHRRPPVAVQRGRKVSIIWRKDPIRLDDEIFEAPGNGAATVTVELERTAAKILVPPPRGINRLWPNWR